MLGKKERKKNRERRVQFGFVCQLRSKRGRKQEKKNKK